MYEIFCARMYLSLKSAWIHAFGDNDGTIGTLDRKVGDQIRRVGDKFEICDCEERVNIELYADGNSFNARHDTTETFVNPKVLMGIVERALDLIGDNQREMFDL
jgi:hypothetical protein